MATLLRDNTGTGLTPNQVIYVNAIVADTGLSARVVAAWTRREAGGADALKYEARHDFNYLNIGKTDSGFMKLTRDTIWHNPEDAGHMTAAFILGTTYKGHHYGAGARIPEIKLTAGKPDEDQIRAIVRSGWATSRNYEGPLRAIYAGIHIPQIADGPPDPPPQPTGVSKARALMLTSPFTKGDDVKRFQRGVMATGGDLEPWNDDGEFGPATKREGRQAAYAVGVSDGKLRKIDQTGRFPVGVVKLISGDRNPWPTEAARAKARRTKPPVTDPGSGAQKAVTWALAQVGAHEEPMGSNSGRLVSLWQRLASMGRGPWCGAFDYVAAAVHGGAKLIGLRCVYVPYIRADAIAGRNGWRRWVTPRAITIGMAVCFDWQGANAGLVDHVGIALGEPRQINGVWGIDTCDGNRGDRVGVHWTPLSLVAGGAEPRW